MATFLATTIIMVLIKVIIYDNTLNNVAYNTVQNSSFERYFYYMLKKSSPFALDFHCNLL